MAELAGNKCKILSCVVNTVSSTMCYINVHFIYLLTYRTDNNGTGCKQQLGAPCTSDEVVSMGD